MFNGRLIAKWLKDVKCGINFCFADLNCFSQVKTIFTKLRFLRLSKRYFQFRRNSLTKLFANNPAWISEIILFPRYPMKCPLWNAFFPTFTPIRSTSLSLVLYYSSRCLLKYRIVQRYKRYRAREHRGESAEQSLSDRHRRPDDIS